MLFTHYHHSVASRHRIGTKLVEKDICFLLKCCMILLTWHVRNQDWLLKWVHRKSFSMLVCPLQLAVYRARPNPVLNIMFLSFYFYVKKKKKKAMIVKREHGSRVKGRKQRESRRGRRRCGRTRSRAWGRAACSPPLLWQHNLWTSVAVKEQRFATYTGMAWSTLSVHVNVCVEKQKTGNYAPSWSILLSHVALSFLKVRSNNAASALDLSISRSDNSIKHICALLTPTPFFYTFVFLN